MCLRGENDERKDQKQWDLQILSLPRTRYSQAERGYAYGKVYSTVPLTEEQMNKIALETGALLKKKILLKNEIDSSLIGGIKVAVDGKLIDASFSSQLKNLCDRVHQF